jgi:hypothetical protein
VAFPPSPLFRTWNRTIFHGRRSWFIIAHHPKAAILRHSRPHGADDQFDGQHRNSTLCNIPRNAGSGSGTTNLYIKIAVNQSSVGSLDVWKYAIPGKHLSVAFDMN